MRQPPPSSLSTTAPRPEVGLLSAVVIVASLGYFVDIYDLVLFSIIRVDSLKGIGVTDPTAITDQGLKLLSMQMWGMLLGGVLWGVLGDKRGRLSCCIRWPILPTVLCKTWSSTAGCAWWLASDWPAS
jgi:putative MFS transporter